jgi:flagellar basal-body rod modification protein FlgD
MSIAALEPIRQQLPEEKSVSNTDTKDELGLNQFLTMLVAQLKHQDPLNPMEGTDFTAQLAQFSGLEQQFAMNDHLEGIQAALDSQENGNILDYIGKTVKTNDNTILVDQGGLDSGAYTLDSGADVNVYIYDEYGIEVRRIHVGRQDAGQHNLDWDGEDNEGEPVADGRYTFEIEALGEDGQFVSARSHILGQVEGVTYQQNIPYLMLGDDLVSPSEVVEVLESNID